MLFVNSVATTSHYCITCNQRAQIVPYTIPHASKLEGKFPQRLLMASPRLHPDLRSTNLLRSLQISHCLNFPAQFRLNSAILHSNGRIATFNDETLSFRMSREEIQQNEIGYVYQVYMLVRFLAMYNLNGVYVSLYS